MNGPWYVSYKGTDKARASVQNKNPPARLRKQDGG